MSETAHTVRVRLAPSPTGHPHIGLGQIGFFNWLFARQHHGQFILRSEDTDRERSSQEYEREIMDALRWLGLNWDEGPTWTEKNGEWISGSQGGYGPYRQSERTEIYKKYLEQLLAEHKAYWCYCTKEELDAEREALTAQGLPPKYSGHCRSHLSPPVDSTHSIHSGQAGPSVVSSGSNDSPSATRSPQALRFRIPETKVEFKDLIRGMVSFDAALFGDIIIAKSITTPLYNFTVVVDDFLMQITHVLRGEDHISNTPKQILLQHALGFSTPHYAHFPLILAADRSKLSKRFAETSILKYRDLGYLPEAMLNFLVLLGWHPSGNEEIFTKDELLQQFDIKRVGKSGAVFNEEKLDWLNREYMKRLSDEDIVSRVQPLLAHAHIDASDTFVLRVVRATRGRIDALHEFLELAGFFFAVPDYDTTLLVWEKDAHRVTRDALTKVSEVLGICDNGQFTTHAIQEALVPLLTVYGKGTVLWPLRVALSGLPVSPDPFVIAETLGREETLRRISSALEKLK